jgi:hypothetical protein
VTKELTLLVAADVNDSSSKLVKARKLGVTIMSLEEFLSAPVPEKAETEEEQPDLFSEKTSEPGEQEEVQLELF